VPDDKSKAGGQDRARINVNQDHELSDWSNSLNTTPDALKKAVAAVGDRAEDVREYLKARQSQTPSPARDSTD